MGKNKGDTISYLNEALNFDSRQKYYKLYEGFDYSVRSKSRNIFEGKVLEAMHFINDVKNNPFDIMGMNYRNDYKIDSKKRDEFYNQINRLFDSTDSDRSEPEEAIQRNLFCAKNHYIDIIGEIFGYEVNLTEEVSKCKVDLMSKISSNEINLIELKRCKISSKNASSDKLLHSVLEICTYKAFFYYAYELSTLKNVLKEYGFDEITKINMCIIGSKNLYLEYKKIENDSIKEFIKKNIKLYVINAKEDLSNFAIGSEEKLFDIEEVEL